MSFCEACNHDYGCPSKLNRHIDSDKHRDRLKELETGIIKVKPTHFCNICDHQCKDSYDFSRHSNTDKHKKKLRETETVIIEENPKHFCEICDHKFVNAYGLSRHLDSPKHQKKLKEIETGMITISGRFCDVCNHEFSSNKHLRRHLDSPKHKNKLQELQTGIVVNNKFCEICNQTFKRPRNLRKHLDSIKHSNKLERLEILNSNIDNDFCIIPMRNKKRDIVGNVIIDRCFYPLIINNAIYMNAEGYACISINGDIYSLHRYIYYNLQGKEPTEEMVIDHKDRNKLNDRLYNLQEITSAENNRNKNKKENATSTFYGVCITGNLWGCNLRHDDINYYFSYHDELWAAYHYDLMVKEFELDYICPLNNVECPHGFIRKIKTEYIKKDGLPEYIYKSGSNFRCRFNGKNTKNKSKAGFNTIEEAVTYRDDMLLLIRAEKEKKQKERDEQALNADIERNPDGIAIVKVINKKGEILREILVDDDIYRYLLHCDHSLSVGKGGYINIWIDGEKKHFHRWILQYDGNLYVDHKDGNILNEQRSNLHLVDCKRNGQNKRAAKNASSKYVGVSFHKKSQKYQAQIAKEYLGSYKTEEEAVIVRNKRAQELNEQGANYNIEYYGQY